MSHTVVDGMLEQSRAGDLRSPVAETFDVHIRVSFDPHAYVAGRGRS